MGTDCVLVYPYFMAYDSTQRRQRSPLPPLGLLYVGAALERAGYSVKVLDCTFLSGVEEAKEALRRLSPRLVGIYSMITFARHAIAMAREARGLGVPVVFGGPDPSLDPGKYLGRRAGDFVVIGEGEVTAVELVNCLLNGSDPRGVKGVAFIREDGGISQTPRREPIQDLDLAPFPDRSLVENERYRRVWLEDHGFAMTLIITSRGCPFGCHFCSNHVAPFGRRYTYRSPSNVVSELDEVVNDYGYDRVWFADDVFTINRRRTLALCEEIVRRGPRFTWSCLTRADLVDEEVLKAMKRAGCDIIYFGVESGSQRMLDLMNRAMTVQEIVEGTLAAKRAGIRIHTFLLLGFPGETYSSIQDTIRIVKRISPDEFSFTIAYPLPGTELFRRVELLSDEVEWMNQGENRLLFKSDIPEKALKFAIWKMKYEFYAHRRAARGQRVFWLLGKVFKLPTDALLKALIPPSAWVPRSSQCDVVSDVIHEFERTPLAIQPMT